MIEILKLSDITQVTHYPKAVVDTIRQFVLNMDTAYGSDRSRDGDGGVELIIESEDELLNVLQALPYGDTPESAEVVHRDFLHAVYIIHNDRSISIFLPIQWATTPMREVLKPCTGSS